MSKFADSPYFALTNYFDEHTIGATPASGGALIGGPLTGIVVNGGYWTDLFIKHNYDLDNGDNDYLGFIKYRFRINSTPKYESNTKLYDGPTYKDNNFNFIKGATATLAASGVEYIRNGSEVYFRKDSHFHAWLVKNIDEYKEFVNTDKMFMYFGKIYHYYNNDDTLFTIIFDGMKDYVERALPYNNTIISTKQKIKEIDNEISQKIAGAYSEIDGYISDTKNIRKSKLIHLFELYFDQIYSEIYNKIKTLWSLMDPREIDNRFLNYIAQIYSMDVDQNDPNMLSQREWVDNLIWFLKRKGTYSDLYILWLIYLKNTSNKLNIYERWHHPDTRYMEDIPLTYFNDVLYEYTYSVNPSGGNERISDDRVVTYVGTSASQWTIQHNLNTRNLIVQCFDNNKNNIWYTNFYPNSSSEIVINFDKAYLGYAFLSKGGCAGYDYYNLFYNLPKNYLHTQTTSASVWDIEHNLNAWNVFVQCYDTNYHLVMPSEIQALDVNQIRLTFDYAIEGKAFIFRYDKLNSFDYDINNPDCEFKHNMGSQVILTQFDDDQHKKVYPDSFDITDLYTSTASWSKPFGGWQTIIEGCKKCIPERVDNSIYVEDKPTSIWLIEHTMNTRYLFVQVYTENYERIYPISIIAIDNDSLVITFNEDISGYAYIEKADYIHTDNESIAELNWNIEHNFNDHALIQFYDNDFNQIVSSVNNYASLDNITSTWGVSTSGYGIVINGEKVIPTPLDSCYYHQELPTSVWEIPHMMDTENIIIQFYNEDNIKINPNLVDSINKSTITAIFPSAYSGYAFISSTNYTSSEEVTGSTWNIEHNLNDNVLVQFDNVLLSKISPYTTTIIDDDNLRAELILAELSYNDDTWNIEHSYGSNVIIQCYDSSNQMIYPESIYPNNIENTYNYVLVNSSIEIKFNSIINGYGYVEGPDYTNIYNSDIWEIEHNGNVLYPIIQCYDIETYEKIDPYEIETIDINTTKVTFESTVNGIANIITNVDYTYTQSIASSAWNIEHSLNTKNLLIEVYNHDSKVIKPLNILNDTYDISIITFSNPVSGYASFKIDEPTLSGYAQVVTADTRVDQSLSASEWIIEHNLNNERVLIQCYDANNKLIAPTNLAILNSNSCSASVPYNRGFSVIKGIDDYNSTDWLIEHNSEVRDVMIQTYDSDNNSFNPSTLTLQTTSSALATHAEIVSGGYAIVKASNGDTQNIPIIFFEPTDWLVHHELNSRNVVVQVYDVNNKLIEPNNIKLLDENTCLVGITNNDFSGYVIVKKYLTNRKEKPVYELVEPPILEILPDIITTFNYNSAKWLMSNNYEGFIIQCYNTENEKIYPEDILIKNDDIIEVKFGLNTEGYGYMEEADYTASVNPIGYNSNLWIIEHNSNVLYPIIQCYDSTTNKRVIPIKIKTIDSNMSVLTFSDPVSGTVNIITNTDYIHTQSIASSIWSIEHSLNNINLLIEVYNSDNEVIFPLNILNNDNTSIITFEEPTSGYVSFKEISYIENQEIENDIGNHYDGMILSPHYKVEMDISCEPLSSTEILPKRIIDFLVSNWEKVRPVSKYSDYHILISPIIDNLNGLYTRLYSTSTYKSSLKSKFCLPAYINYPEADVYTQETISIIWQFTNEFECEDLLIQCYNTIDEMIVPSYVSIDINTITIIFDDSISGYVCVGKVDEMEDGYLHTQNTSASIWDIDHEMNEINIISQYRTLNNEMMIPSGSSIIDSNNIEIEFGLNINSNYVYIRTILNSIWQIPHNLHTNDFIIQCYDDSYEMIYPSDVSYDDNGYMVTLTFNEKKMGYAYLIKSDEAWIQSFIDDEWVIQHDQASEKIITQFQDSYDTNKLIIPLSVSTYDGNTINATFNEEIIGKCVVSNIDYTYTQSVTASTWTVEHNQNNNKFVMQVYNEDSVEIIPNSFIINDENTCTLTFNDNITGTVVMKFFTTETWEYSGEQGFGLISKDSYTHDQLILSSTWNINHNFDKKEIFISTYDENDNEIWANTIILTDDNNCIVTFDTPVIGKAVLKSTRKDESFETFFNDTITWKIGNGGSDSFNPINTNNLENVTFSGSNITTSSDDNYYYLDFELRDHTNYKDITEIGIFDSDENIVLYTYCNNIHKPKNVSFNVRYRIEK